MSSICGETESCALNCEHNLSAFNKYLRKALGFSQAKYQQVEDL